MKDRLGILIVAANPKDTLKLELKEELRRLRNRMSDNVEIGNAELLVAWAARPPDLQTAVRENRPQIVHFAGHGSRDGVWLENDEGNSQLLSKESLTLILGASPELRLVVLNACATAWQTEALRGFVEYVVGTPALIEDSVALDFTSHFYRGLAVGNTVRDAFYNAQKKLGIQNQERYQLFVRDDVDESKPLIPPFDQDKIKIRLGDLTTTGAVEVTGTLNEGEIGAREVANKRSEIDFSAQTVSAETFRVAGEINRLTSKQKR